MITTWVRGTLKAIGNSQDSIQFTAPDTLTNWEIDLYYITPNNDSSIFHFACEKSNGQLAPLEMIFLMLEYQIVTLEITILIRQLFFSGDRI